MAPHLPVFFVSWLHLTGQPCFGHNDNVFSLPQDEVVNEFTDISMEATHIGVEDCQVRSEPFT